MTAQPTLQAVTLPPLVLLHLRQRLLPAATGRMSLWFLLPALSIPVLLCTWRWPLLHLGWVLAVLALVAAGLVLTRYLPCFTGTHVDRAVLAAALASGRGRMVQGRLERLQRITVGRHAGRAYCRYIIDGIVHDVQCDLPGPQLPGIVLVRSALLGQPIRLYLPEHGGNLLLGVEYPTQIKPYRAELPVPANTVQALRRRRWQGLYAVSRKCLLALLMLAITSAGLQLPPELLVGAALSMPLVMAGHYFHPSAVLQRALPVADGQLQHWRLQGFVDEIAVGQTGVDLWRQSTLWGRIGGHWHVLEQHATAPARPVQALGREVILHYVIAPDALHQLSARFGQASPIIGRRDCEPAAAPAVP